jgi:mono/diheme cytochrome c family protein
VKSICAAALVFVCTGCITFTGCHRGSPDAGAVVYTKYCFGCHRGGNTQAFAPSLSGYLRQGKHDESETRRIIRDGKGNMPPFRRRLSRSELNDLLDYMKTL